MEIYEIENIQLYPNRFFIRILEIKKEKLIDGSYSSTGKQREVIISVDNKELIQEYKPLLKDYGINLDNFFIKKMDYDQVTRLKEIERLSKKTENLIKTKITNDDVIESIMNQNESTPSKQG